MNISPSSEHARAAAAVMTFFPPDWKPEPWAGAIVTARRDGEQHVLYSRGPGDWEVDGAPVDAAAGARILADVNRAPFVIEPAHQQRVSDGVAVSDRWTGTSQQRWHDLSWAGTRAVVDAIFALAPRS